MTTPETQREMPFLDHLDELRVRLTRIVLGILAGTLVSFLWSNWLFAGLTAPIRENFEQMQLIGTGPADAFIVKIVVALFSGFLISAPHTFYQLWNFIVPALHEHERRLAFPFVAATTLCFAVGVSFCFFVVFPFAFQFFSKEFLSIGLSPQIRISEYLSFVLKLILIFGCMFEMPVLIFLLGRLGIIRHEQLRNNLRLAIVVIFIIAAIVTPPDVITQLLLAVPLCFLYWACIFVCRYAEGLRVAPSTKS